MHDASTVLFNSYAFLFAFLPLALVAFFGLGHLRAGRVAMPVLVVASLGFYAYWDWRNLFILAPSLLVNFFLGHWLTVSRATAEGDPARARTRKLLLVAGLVFNLGLLGWFKYLDFLIGTASFLASPFGVAALPLQHLVLPLGISFFTFEQIAYIVDAHRGQPRPYGFLEYCVFVTFYPHLIAGPIIQHNELMDQLGGKVGKPNAENLALGFTMLIAGLFKKVVIADTCMRVVPGVYDHGVPSLSMVEAWIGTIGYSLQLYFDFSGYSDMAIGLALMVNVRLPQNFNSPYKAHNPIEFWRRWHMTLSRFLRNYLYIPLGGNRGSEARRYFNLFMTMLLGGLWHGAGWGFVLWGGLNGFYLVVNNLFRKWRKAPKENEPEGPWWLVELACLWTFFLIMLSRVFFRSPTFSTAWGVLRSLFGAHGVGLEHVVENAATLVGFALLYLFCRHAPNTQQVLSSLSPVYGKVEAPSRVQVRLSPAVAVVVAGMALASLLKLTAVSEFLYFQF
jgi:D-alanyl-lipoteichoic acid acyltransferase DltB (MBOAT superfamily)